MLLRRSKEVASKRALAEAKEQVQKVKAREPEIKNTVNAFRRFASQWLANTEGYSLDLTHY